MAGPGRCGCFRGGHRWQGARGAHGAASPARHGRRRRARASPPCSAPGCSPCSRPPRRRRGRGSARRRARGRRRRSATPSSIADLAAAHPRAAAATSTARPGCARAPAGWPGSPSWSAVRVGAAAAAGVFGAYVLPSAPLPAACSWWLVAIGLNIGGRPVDRAERLGAGRGLAGGAVWSSSAVGPVRAAGPPTGGPPADPASRRCRPRRGGPLGVLTAAAFVFFAFAGVARAAELGGEACATRCAPSAPDGRAGAAGSPSWSSCWSRRPAESASAPSASRSPRRRSRRSIDNGGSAGASACWCGSARPSRRGPRCSRLLSRASRTALAMAQGGDLPRWIGRTGPRGHAVGGRPPRRGGRRRSWPRWRARLTALALSACSLLVYYALLHVAVLRLPDDAAARRGAGIAGAAVMLPVGRAARRCCCRLAGRCWSAAARRSAVESDGGDGPARTGDRCAGTVRRALPRTC